MAAVASAAVVLAVVPAVAGPAVAWARTPGEPSGGATAGAAGGQVFGIAGKSLDDVNFVAVWRGCDEEVRLQGDRCVHIGASGAAQPRLQDAAIAQALQGRLDGLAVSVTHSGLLGVSSLAQAARRGVPLITFDSDLEPAQRDLRRAYVGVDNEAVGRRVGELLRELRPAGGRLCLLSADQRDPNLLQRLRGVRAALAGVQGWQEPSRCPWTSGDDPARAVRQLVATFEEVRADVFVSVGAWPLLDAARYRAAVAPGQAQRRAAGQHIVIVTGELSEAQQALRREGLVDAVVAIDFHRMGRAAYRTMKRLAGGQPVEPWQWLEPQVLRR